MIYIIAAILLVGVDQLVKFIVKAKIPLGSSVDFLPGFLRLTHVENNGAAFSSFQGARWPLIILTILVLIVAVTLIRRGIVKNRFGKWAATVVIAGAVGNLIDRIATGLVVDMFEFEFMRFAVFNVADIFVVCGGIAVCLYVFFMHETKKPAEKRTESDGETNENNC